MKVERIGMIVVAVAIFLVGYWLGGYNHEKDIIHACEEYSSAEIVSWTGDLGFCKKLDDSDKTAVIVK